MSHHATAEMEQRYRRALRNIPPPGMGQGCHPSLLGVANYGVMAGHSDQAIFSDIRGAIPPGQRRVPDSGIRNTVSRARRDHQRNEYTPRSCRKKQVTSPRLELDGPAYTQSLIRRSRGATDMDLLELSPVRLSWRPGPRDAVELLRTLYGPNEILFIGRKYDRGVASVTEWVRRIERQEHATWPHIIPNPVDGKTHETSMGKQSLRGDRAIASFRYILVEFDDLSLAHQQAFWYTIIDKGIFPVTALISSGGKSLHAWIRADIPDRQTWDRIVKKDLYGPTGRLTLMGADRACCNPARLSRLPGHFRTGKGNVQKLFYLNPESQGECERQASPG